MPSTYSSNLKLELMATGENSGTWGNITNTNFGTAAEQAIVGYGAVSYASDANLTISITNSNAAQAARALVLNVTSAVSLTGTRELVVPTIEKQYIVQNNTTGSQSITVKTSAGTGITVPNGRKAHLYVDGTNVIQMFDFVDINGGAIDGTTIGASSASTGAFTTLNASGATTLDGNVTLGNASGDTVTVTGTIASNLLFTDNTYDIGASGATRPRNLFLAGAATIGGNLSVGGTLTLTGGLILNGNVTVGDNASDTLTINATITSNLLFTDNTYDIGASGATRPRNLFLAGNATIGGNQTLTGSLTVDSTTDSSSTTTGSIQTDGGLGVAKALYVGTTANIAGAVTLSGGTANGVAFLNGSKVLTTGSALTFDGTNLLQVSAAAGKLRLGVNTSDQFLDIYRDNSTGASVYNAAQGSGFGFHVWQVAGSEVARLTSTGLKSSIAGTNADPVFSYTSDTNTGIFFPAADKLGFVAGGGADQMVLTTTGLGIGTSSPAALLHLSSGSGTKAIWGTTRNFTVNRNFQLAVDEYAEGQFTITPSTTLGGTTFTTPVVAINATGNVGIGTSSPGEKLEVVGVAKIRTSGGSGIQIVSAATPYIQAFGASGNTVLQLNGQSISFWSGASYGAESEKMRLDSSGNLGLGVTPSASNLPTIESDYGLISGKDEVNIIQSAYYNSGFKYSKAEAAGRYLINSGIHSWHTAPSGTAGNAISFSQAMTLTADGNLGLGTTSPRNASGYKNFVLDGSTSGLLDVNTNGTRVFSLYGAGNDINLVNPTATGTMQFYTNNTERARILSGGEVLIGATALASYFDGKFNVAGRIHTKIGTATDSNHVVWNEATSGDNGFVIFGTEATYTIRGSIDYNRAGGLTRYNTTSDYRAKDIIGPVQNPGATIDALKVYEGVMKGATQSRPMLVAHEAQEHAPYAVSGVKDEVNEDGTPKFQQMDVSSLVPLLLAEIQSLRQRLAAAGI